jgi:hypothetical protein
MNCDLSFLVLCLGVSVIFFLMPLVNNSIDSNHCEIKVATLANNHEIPVIVKDLSDSGFYIKLNERVLRKGKPCTIKKDDIIFLGKLPDPLLVCFLGLQRCETNA